MNIFNLIKFAQTKPIPLSQHTPIEDIQFQQPKINPIPLDQQTQLKDIKFQDEKELPEITEKDIKQDSPQQESKSAQPLKQPVKKEYPNFSTVYNAYRWAKDNKEVLRITYRTISGRVIIRDIQPHGDYFPKTTKRRNFVTFDETVGDIRAFIMNFIQQYTFINRQFTPRFNFSQTRANFKRRIRRRNKRKIENKKNIRKSIFSLSNWNKNVKYN